MFEEYLQDTAEFISDAARSVESGDDRTARRYFRAAAMTAVAALETFVNFIASTFEKAPAGGLQQYELALLLDRRFSQERGKFGIQNQLLYSRLEDKLRFLISRFSVQLDLGKSQEWADFIALKRLRDDLVHSREEDDCRPVEEYRTACATGLSASISLMNRLSEGIFSRPLRAKLVELAADYRT